MTADEGRCVSSFSWAEEFARPLVVHGLCFRDSYSAVQLADASGYSRQQAGRQAGSGAVAAQGVGVVVVAVVVVAVVVVVVVLVVVDSGGGGRGRGTAAQL